MADEEPARPPADDIIDDELLPLRALTSGRFVHDDDDDDVEPAFPADDPNNNKDEDNPSPPSSPAGGPKEHGWLRIQNVGGSLTFLLQVGCPVFCLTSLLVSSPLGGAVFRGVCCT